jgi:Xaa-Pro aminopeptidase
MRRHEIDCWIILSRESHPDPLLEDIGGGWPGIRNAYLFFDRGGAVPEKIFIGSHESREDFFVQVYDHLTYYGYAREGLAPILRAVVDERRPQRIGVNMSSTIPMADGLSVMLKEYLLEAIGQEYTDRLVSAELVARDFRANRVPEEYEPYQRLCEWTVAWCAEALSSRVIRARVSTAADVHWWMRDQARRMGLALEFLPGVRLNRKGIHLPTNSPDESISPGDIVTLDAGLAFDFYRSDYQRTAYILGSDEESPPTSLARAYADAIRVRDRVVTTMRPGMIGHKLFEQTMEWAQQEGYQPMYPLSGGLRPTVRHREAGVYCHSIGNSTHDIGAWIAVDWPAAHGDRVRYPLEVGQWYSVELGVNIPIPEWDGLSVFIGIEEDVALTESGVDYFASPQESLILVPS